MIFNLRLPKLCQQPTPVIIDLVECMRVIILMINASINGFKIKFTNVILYKKYCIKIYLWIVSDIVILNSWKNHCILSTYLITFISYTINHANIRLGSTCFSKKELTIQIDFLSIKNWVLSVYYTIGIINMATFFL